jgi:hypothetical protein
MPEVSRFYGIIIQIYLGDHSPPHFHALYGEFSAVIDWPDPEKRDILKIEF